MWNRGRLVGLGAHDLAPAQSVATFSRAGSNTVSRLPRSLRPFPIAIGSPLETTVLTPQKVFGLPQFLLVPLFQRRYVWEETNQWEPLWQDVMRLAGLWHRDPQSHAQHFLGAVVVQGTDVPTGSTPMKNVIDGQQRLTSLQLLIDATAAVLTEHGTDSLAEELAFLTHNPSFDPTEERMLKLTHTNCDREAFVEVMNAEPPVDHADLTHSGSLIVRAHEYFCGTVADWLGAPDGDGYTSRAGALVHALSHGLQVVVIDLKPEENSQEIFETLNARGTPLTAAELIKNLVFQRLEAEGVNTAMAYAEDWPFESAFWETDVSVGRVTTSRSSLFLGQWLAARLGEEISPKRTFNRFKHHVDHEADTKVSDLLAAIKAQAGFYEQWTVAAEDKSRLLSPTERAVYRMQCAGMELLKPALIWLHDPALGIPQRVADEVIGHLESWVIRRQLLRLPTAQLGAVVADVIRTHRTAPPEELSQRVSAHLARQAVVSTYWPGDEEIRTHLETEKVYRRFSRARLRMYLEAIEDNFRSIHDSPAMPRLGNPIEHVLPQKWQEQWPVEGLEAEIDRSEHVHRLGNLTLLTKSLNSSVSNGPWEGKRAKLDRHDVFLLNRLLLKAKVWDEAAIDARTRHMLDALLATWPVPEGHEGTIDDPDTRNKGWVEVKDLVAGGLLATGTLLQPRDGGATVARVTHQGMLQVDCQTFDSPSAAARHVREGRSTNGWWWWLLEDGRKLMDVRAEFRGEKPGAQSGFDWSPLHRILEQLPEGRWTSYGELADAIGAAPQPLGNHVVDCRHCVNAWRVLTVDGQMAEGFRWRNTDDIRDPVQVLQQEGITFVSGKADPERRLSGDDLADLR
jgi:alkylated DNA nucleotide flippase Atl1